MGGPISGLVSGVSGLVASVSILHALIKRHVSVFDCLNHNHC